MALKEISFYRKTTAPSAGQWVNDSIYLIQKTAGVDADLYFVNSSGTPFNLGNAAFFLARLNEQKGQVNGVATLDGSGKIPASQLPTIATASELIIEAVYADLIANSPSYGANRIVLVKDASGDPNTTSGAALYVWDEGNSTIERIAEFESLDVSLSFFAKVTGAGTSAEINDGDTIEFEAGTNLSITRTGNVFKFDLTGAAPHSHTNLALLETYTQTEADLASAVSLKHSHANKALLDTYNQTNAAIAGAVSNSHSHANKALLDTYSNTNADISTAITNSHTHSNKTILDALTVTNSRLYYNGEPVLNWASSDF